MICKIDVTGSEAIAYIREQLFLASKSLSVLISQHSLEKGKIYSIVPDTTSNEQLYNFISRGIYPFEKKLLKKTPALVPVQNDSIPVLLEMIHSHLNHSEGNCCVFEDTVGKPSDAWVKKSRIEYVHLNDEMYYFFNKENDDNAKLDRARSNSGSYYFLCVLSCLNPEDHIKFSSFQKISLELLKCIAENTKAFFVRAYDGEGYLMWKAARA